MFDADKHIKDFEAGLVAGWNEGLIGESPPAGITRTPAWVAGYQIGFPAALESAINLIADS